jgi:glycosyltransferase involved in cell wall biosynthesis
MKIRWVTEYEGISNSFGYAVHNDRARAAMVAAGAVLDPTAEVAMHVCPPHRLEPIEGCRNVAYVAWEARETPDVFRASLSRADAVCVTSRFLVPVMQRLVPRVPVYWVPLGVGDEFQPVDRMDAKRRPFGKSAKHRHGRPFRFLWCGAPNARKGAFQVIEAWRAFTEGPGERLKDRAELYIKTSQAAGDKTAKGLQYAGNVTIDDRKVPLAELVRIYQSAHCFVFPTVGEGFGLTAAEAAATGLPVIYTPDTAMLDLFDGSGELALPYVPTRQTWDWKDSDGRGTPMTVDVEIAVAQPEAVAAAMLAVFHDPPKFFALGRQVGERIHDSFTWKRCGELLLNVAHSVSHYHPLP